MGKTYESLTERTDNYVFQFYSGFLSIFELEEKIQKSHIENIT